MPDGSHTPGQMSGVPSASVTATTVFQGLNHGNDSIMNIHNDSILGSQFKHPKESGDTMQRMVTPGSGSFQALKNNLVNESPITMMNMSEDKGRLIGAGDTLIHGSNGAAYIPNSNQPFEYAGSQLVPTEINEDYAMIIDDRARAKAGKPPQDNQDVVPSESYFKAVDEAQRWQEQIEVEDFGGQH